MGDFCKHLNILEKEFDHTSIWTNAHVPLTGHASVNPVTPGGVLPMETSPFRGDTAAPAACAMRKVKI